MSLSAVISAIMGIQNRNIYTQDTTLRQYVFTPYTDGKYYSDCSSLMWKAFKNYDDLYIGANSDAQWDNGELVYQAGTTPIGQKGTIPLQQLKTAGLRAGDILFWGDRLLGGIDLVHVEMYIGNDQIIGHGSGIGPTIKNARTYKHSHEFIGCRRYDTEALDYYTGNRWLSIQEMQTNATYIYQKLINEGWTINAICGFLGNVQQESTINPGIWQGTRPPEEGETNWGYGLTQWTPYTKYTDFCDAHQLAYDRMDSALTRIKYEVENEVQWDSTSHPSGWTPISFKQFTESNEDCQTLAVYFLYGYERPREIEQKIATRKENAQYWLNYFGGYNPPIRPDPPTPSTDISTSKMIYYLKPRRKFI